MIVWWRPVIGIALSALAQTAVLGWMIYERISLINSGREIVLPIVPVDPRDLFRGEYVQLAYPAARVPTGLFSAQAPALSSTPFFVTLQQNGDGNWSPINVTQQLKPAAQDSQVVLKARRREHWWPPSGEVTVNYGIERYYIPEGKGLELEGLARNRKLAAVIAVDAKGNAAIKGLAIDGKLRYEEPLF
jgi:uncharacterized membrane-anchored protein